ncbi:MAG: pyridoxal 5'-phosphate synthase subunit PdxT [Acidimicrobiia bacterium]|nr:MAG: pyridoxal 5'-phosphate synthase subunit PdxT [Acidimicrobiia bacterium]
MKVGVLALQGAFREHAEALGTLGADVTLVKRPEHLAGVDAIVLPGGESTTIDKLLDTSGLREPLLGRLHDGLPAFATCAGLIVCAGEVVDGRPDQRPLGVLDVTVRRNGYGRQRESFEADLDVPALAGGAFRGIFIRAPVVERAGAAVEVLAAHDGVPVLGRQGAIWFSSFHPELAGDLRLHESFLHEVG